MKTEEEVTEGAPLADEPVEIMELRDPADGNGGDMGRGVAEGVSSFDHDGVEEMRLPILN